MRSNALRLCVLGLSIVAAACASTDPAPIGRAASSSGPATGPSGTSSAVSGATTSSGSGGAGGSTDTVGSGGAGVGTGGSAGTSGSGGGSGIDDAGSQDGGREGAVDAMVAADAQGDGPGVTDPGTEGDGDFMINGPYRLPPEATLGQGVPAGRIQTIMVSSQVFAGTTRAVQVYTPSQYVPSTPVAFMVLQDGGAYIANFKLPTVLDNMIFKKQLPVIVAIFVNANANNRSFEYDSLTDLYTRFVLDEVLPAVEKSFPIKLTTDPEGRSAGGHSSGGIAAFTMGWLRPDQFRRILTHSGSFTNIRGGDQYPNMVRMTTPNKPLRVYLSAGTNDLQPPRWQQANVNMAAALAAKSYHYRFVLLNGGTHDQSYPATNLPESLLWLWRGYPITGK